MSEVIHSSPNGQLNKRKLINSIEQLSNEIIYDIFSCLDGCDAYYAFSNLNNRFQNLLDHASLLLNITYLYKSNSALTDRYERLIHQNKHNILSLQFYDQFFLEKFSRLCAINSSFTLLQSIIFHEISTFRFMVLLVYLKSLPCLSSLTVCIDNFYDDLGDVYQIIFHLSNLKYFKLKILDYQVSHINIPIAIDEQFSSLEYLVISHPVSLDELAHLLSYTPKVTHLYCSNIIETEHIIKSEELIELKNLIHLTITTNYLTFDKFEQFFLKSFVKLETITLMSHHAYLQCWQW